MAKKRVNKKEETKEPVTICDQSKEVVETNDHPEKGEVTLSQYDIEKLIVTVRGEQVLIDRDLAYIYQVEVKQMNRQVKRNIERFPEDFMFQLTKEEYNSLKCHFGTSNKRGGDRRALPYAFTQQGVGMLSGLLRSQVAIETNIKIVVTRTDFPDRVRMGCLVLRVGLGEKCKAQDSSDRQFRR